MAKKVAFTVFYDEHTGELEAISPTKRFDNEGPLFRLDVIKDVIETLERVYKHERSSFFSHLQEAGEA